MGDQRPARHVLGIRADALEYFLAADRKPFATRLMDATAFVEFPRLRLDARGDVVRLVLHQSVHGSLCVRRKACGGRQTVKLLGKLPDPSLVFRRVRLRHCKSFLRLGASGNQFADFLCGLFLFGFKGVVPGCDGGHALLGGAGSLGSLLRFAARGTHTRLGLLQSGLQSFDFPAKQVRFAIAGNFAFGRGYIRSRRRLGGSLFFKRRTHLHDARTRRKASA